MATEPVSRLISSNTRLRGCELCFTGRVEMNAMFCISPSLSELLELRSLTLMALWPIGSMHHFVTQTQPGYVLSSTAIMAGRG